MIVIRNQNELKSQRNKIKEESVLDSLEIDIRIITECYDSQSDEYGPLIILINEDEQQEMEEKDPIIKQLEPEEYCSIYEDEKTLIERTCYILTDAGFIVYVRRKKFWYVWKEYLHY